MLALLFAATLVVGAPDTSNSFLYRTLLLRAAPGALLEVIDLYQARLAVYAAAGDEPPFMMRHSQGDQWDLLLVFPMKSFSDFYAPARVSRREQAARQAAVPDSEFQQALDARVAWREEVFVAGPPLDIVETAFAGTSYFHVEMFIALPAKRAELLEQRRMENIYLAALERPQNLIFTRAAGAAWDLYTIGFYRDIKHFAESADITEDREAAAALEAGFEGPDRIGTYLRTLIQSHHDTLAGAVR